VRIDALESECVAVESALKEYELHAKNALEHAKQINDPKVLSVLIDWIQDLREAVNDDVTASIRKLRGAVAGYRPGAIAKISADTEYQSLWAQSTGPLINRVDRTVPRRNDMHDTILLALSIASVRMKAIEYRAELDAGAPMPPQNRIAIEERLKIMNLLTTTYAYPHMLDQTATHTFAPKQSVKIPSFKRLLPDLYGDRMVMRNFNLERI
jgi:hypothetical protein